MRKVVQVKTQPDEDHPEISTVTTTTFDRSNILDSVKNLYKWFV